MSIQIPTSGGSGFALSGMLAFRQEPRGRTERKAIAALAGLEYFRIVSGFSGTRDLQKLAMELPYAMRADFTAAFGPMQPTESTRSP